MEISEKSAEAPIEKKSLETLEQVTLRFAGDSGDGMQLTGSRFTLESAFLGNDLATQPDFPAEIRAPAGSLPGVEPAEDVVLDHVVLVRETKVTPVGVADDEQAEASRCADAGIVDHGDRTRVWPEGQVASGRGPLHQPG